MFFEALPQPTMTTTTTECILKGHLNRANLQVSHGCEDEFWRRGAEEYRGRRLLPHIVDYHARNNPRRRYAVIPKTGDLRDGLEDIDMGTVAAAVDSMAWWIDHEFGESQKAAIAYVGPSDLRYPIISLAAWKCRWKVCCLRCGAAMLIAHQFNAGLVHLSSKYGCAEPQHAANCQCSCPALCR